MKIFSLLLCVASAACAADLPRVLPPGQLPNDARLGPLKDLDGYFPFTPSPTPEAWEERAQLVRRQIQVSQGLWPAPTKTPLNAVVHGRLEQDDYTVEKVYFESMPGFFVTGSLFRPKGKPGPYPAVLCPHGHWDEARFRLLGDAELKKELESGGERLPNGGRSIFQSLGVQLARMGCVALVYDMIGYCDSKQISFELAHRFAKQRPEMNSPEAWGFFSPQAESHLQSIMGLQTWNSIRALDFLTELPEVDPKRLGCTGASGGGTQTMILAALDPRLAVACPAVMVSTSMQGGCTCENASGLRVGTGNVEFAALFAPKPQGLTAANDWTKEMETKGFPELQKHYEMLGARENVALWAMLNFGHNYNAPSREKIYAWFNKHFRLGLADAQLVEREYPVLTREQLTVWDASHPAPSGGPEFEKKLLRWWRDDARQQMAKDFPAFRNIALPALKSLVRWDPNSEPFEFESPSGASAASDQNPADAPLQRFLLSKKKEQVQLPLLLKPAKPDRRSRVLWISSQGKKALAAPGEEEQALVAKLIAAGHSVAAPDLFMQGEFLSAGESDRPTRVVKNPRESAAYTFGYNDTLFSQRVRDLVAIARSLRRSTRLPDRLAFVALDPTAAAVAAAAAAIITNIDALVLDTGGFRFVNVGDIRDPMFFPGGARYGDLPGLLALSDPRKTYLIGEKPASSRGANAPGVPHAPHVAEQRDLNAAISWLIDALKAPGY